MRKFLIGARKYLIGALVGAALVFGSQVFADGLIGKEVQGEITVVFDGTELSTTGVVIDGVSYLPLRAIGTVLGLGVDYADGTVTLTSPQKEAAETVSQLKDEIKAELKQEQEEAERIKKIEGLKRVIADLEEQLANPEKYGFYAEFQLQGLRDSIETFKKQLAELEAD